MTSSPTTTTCVITSTAALYDGWALTYDTDSNVLQLLDTLAFEASVVPLLQQQSRCIGKPGRLLELGCGTGRNTRKIKNLMPRGSTLFATDFSKGMLDEARKTVTASDDSNDGAGVKIRWAQLDIQTQQTELDAFLSSDSDDSLGSSDTNKQVDAIVSTLVLEHVPLDEFFAVISRVLKPDGWAWVTDMHPEMGESKAGYRREEDGVKVSGISYNHGLVETLDSARRFGLEIEGKVDERGVGNDKEAALREFGERAKKWVGKQMLVGMLFKKVVEYYEVES